MYPMASIEPTPRFQKAQVNRSIVHPLLPQPPLEESIPQHNDTNLSDGTAGVRAGTSHSVEPVAMSHTFVVAADTQLGMINENKNWEIEMEYSRRAVEQINALDPRPLYCCICGDLVDMCSGIYKGKPKRFPKQDDITTIGNTPVSEQVDVWSEEECDNIQDQQNNDMKQIWYHLHPDIALICLCGNHDVGNRPTPQSIQKFNDNFGDDYLAFWVNGTYNIVLNSALFSDPTDTMLLYDKQLHWLEQQLLYAHRCSARNIFVFSHHPWFLYNEDEDTEDLNGLSYLVPGNTELYVSDSYFPIPKVHRQRVMKLFQQYNVSACFAGHFHQNVISQSTFGMEMIVTGGLSMVLESTSNPNVRNEPSTQGFRIVTVQHNSNGDKGIFHHRFVSVGKDET
jgi:serine/threonine-protein phosphatase CPPED1